MVLSIKIQIIKIQSWFLHNLKMERTDLTNTQSSPSKSPEILDPRMNSQDEILISAPQEKPSSVQKRHQLEVKGRPVPSNPSRTLTKRMNSVDNQFQIAAENHLKGQKDEPKIMEGSTAEILRESNENEAEKTGGGDRQRGQSQAGVLSTIKVSNSERDSTGKDVSPTMKVHKIMYTTESDYMFEEYKLKPRRPSIADLENEAIQEILKQKQKTQQVFQNQKISKRESMGDTHTVDSFDMTYMQALEGRFEKIERQDPQKQRPRTSVGNYNNRQPKGRKVLQSGHNQSLKSLHNDPYELSEMRQLGTQGSSGVADFQIYMQKNQAKLVKPEEKKSDVFEKQTLQSLVAVLKNTKRGVSTAKSNPHGQNGNKRQKKPRVQTAYQRIKNAQSEFQRAIDFKKNTALENRRIFVDEGLMRTKMVKNIKLHPTSSNRNLPLPSMSSKSQTFKRAHYNETQGSEIIQSVAVATREKEQTNQRVTIDSLVVDQQPEEDQISRSLKSVSNKGTLMKRPETSQSAQRRYLAKQNDYNSFQRKQTAPQIQRSPKNSVVNSLTVISPSHYNFQEHKRSHPSMLYPQMHLCGSRSDILIQNHIVDKVNKKKYNVFIKQDKQDRIQEIQAFQDYCQKLQKYQDIINESLALGPPAETDLSKQREILQILQERNTPQIEAAKDKLQTIQQAESSIYTGNPSTLKKRLSSRRQSAKSGSPVRRNRSKEVEEAAQKSLREFNKGISIKIENISTSQRDRKLQQSIEDYSHRERTLVGMRSIEEKRKSITSKIQKKLLPSGSRERSPLQPPYQDRAQSSSSRQMMIRSRSGASPEEIKRQEEVAGEVVSPKYILNQRDESKTLNEQGMRVSPKKSREKSPSYARREIEMQPIVKQMIPIKLTNTGNNSKKAQGFFKDKGQSPIRKNSSISQSVSPAKETGENGSNVELISPAKLSPQFHPKIIKKELSVKKYVTNPITDTKDDKKVPRAQRSSVTKLDILSQKSQSGASARSQNTQSRPSAQKSVSKSHNQLYNEGFKKPQLNTDLTSLEENDYSNYSDNRKRFDSQPQTQKMTGGIISEQGQVDTEVLPRRIYGDITGFQHSKSDDSVELADMKINAAFMKHELYLLQQIQLQHSQGLNTSLPQFQMNSDAGTGVVPFIKDNAFQMNTFGPPQAQSLHQPPIQQNNQKIADQSKDQQSKVNYDTQNTMELSDFQIISKLFSQQPLIYQTNQTLNSGFKVIGPADSKEETDNRRSRLGSQNATRPSSAIVSGPVKLNKKIAQKVVLYQENENEPEGKGGFFEQAKKMSRELGDGSNQFQKNMRIVSASRRDIDLAHHRRNSHESLPEDIEQEQKEDLVTFLTDVKEEIKERQQSKDKQKRVIEGHINQSPKEGNESIVTQKISEASQSKGGKQPILKPSQPSTMDKIEAKEHEFQQIHSFQALAKSQSKTIMQQRDVIIELNQIQPLNFKRQNMELPKNRPLSSQKILSISPSSKKRISFITNNFTNQTMSLSQTQYQDVFQKNRYNDSTNYMRPKTALNSKQNVYADRTMVASQKVIARRETLANQSQKISDLIEMTMSKQSQGGNTRTRASLEWQSGLVKESVLKKNTKFAHGGRKLVQKKNLKLQKQSKSQLAYHDRSDVNGSQVIINFIK